jgi:hypothetical protein
MIYPSKRSWTTSPTAILIVFALSHGISHAQPAFLQVTHGVESIHGGTIFLSDCLEPSLEAKITIEQVKGKSQSYTVSATQLQREALRDTLRIPTTFIINGDTLPAPAVRTPITVNITAHLRDTGNYTGSITLTGGKEGSQTFEIVVRRRLPLDAIEIPNPGAVQTDGGTATVRLVIRERSGESPVAIAIRPIRLSRDLGERRFVQAAFDTSEIDTTIHLEPDRTALVDRRFTISDGYGRYMGTIALNVGGLGEITRNVVIYHRMSWYCAVFYLMAGAVILYVLRLIIMAMNEDRMIKRALIDFKKVIGQPGLSPDREQPELSTLRAYAKSFSESNYSFGSHSNGNSISRIKTCSKSLATWIKIRQLINSNEYSELLKPYGSEFENIQIGDIITINGNFSSTVERIDKLATSIATEIDDDRKNLLDRFEEEITFTRKRAYRHPAIHEQIESRVAPLLNQARSKLSNDQSAAIRLFDEARHEYISILLHFTIVDACSSGIGAVADAWSTVYTAATWVHTHRVHEHIFDVYTEMTMSYLSCLTLNLKIQVETNRASNPDRSLSDAANRLEKIYQNIQSKKFRQATSGLESVRSSLKEITSPALTHDMRAWLAIPVPLYGDPPASLLPSPFNSEEQFSHEPHPTIPDGWSAPIWIAVIALGAFLGVELLWEHNLTWGSAASDILLMLLWGATLGGVAVTLSNLAARRRVDIG